MTFSCKLFVSFSLVGLIALSLSGGSSYICTKDRLRQDAVDRLTAIRDNRAKIVEYYFSQKRSQVQLLAKSVEVAQASENFRIGFQMLEQELNLSDISRKKMASTLSGRYREISEKHPVHSRNKDNKEHGHGYSVQPRMLPDSTEGKILQSIYSVGSSPTDMNHAEKERFPATTYSQAQKKYHPLLQSYLKEFRFYDFFIIDSKTGVITYSVKKEIDFGTSLLTGPYKDSNLAKLFAQVQGAKKPAVLYADFEHYVPSADIPSSFFAYPIFLKNKQIGVLAAQLSVEELNDVLTDNQQWASAGLGETGETYLVGSDRLMRNDSRFLLEALDDDVQPGEKKKISPYVWEEIPPEKTTILHQDVHSDTSEQAFSGKAGVDISIDYRGVKVVSAFRPIDIPDVDWILLAEMDTEEVFHDLYTFKIRMLIIMIALLLFVVLFSYYMARLFSRPVKQLVTDIQQFGPNALDYRISLSGKDEFADIANAFNETAERLQNKTVSLDYFDMIITSMTDMLLVINIDNHTKRPIIQDANQAACKLLGYDRNEIIGMRFEKILVNPQEKELFGGEKMKNLTTLCSVRGIEQSYRTKAGIELPVLFSCSALVPIKEDTQKGIVAIAQEISELKTARLRMEEQIRLLSLDSKIGMTLTQKTNLQEMLHQCCTLLVSHLNIAFVRIWLFDERKSTLTMQASAGIYPNTDGEERVKDIHDNDRISDIALTRNPQLRNIISKNRTIHDQEWLLKEYSTVFAGYPLLVEDEIIGVIALFSENILSETAMKSIRGAVNEIALGVQKKRTEFALIASERMHKEAQRIAKIGHWDLSLPTNELRWSDELFNIFEMSAEYRGIVSYDFFIKKVHPDDREFLKKAYSESLKNRTDFDLTHRILFKDGRIKYLHEKCKSEYDENGNPLRSIGTSQDITALKVAEIEKEEAEGRFRQAQKMEAIGTLAGGIAHDFNNLLNAIIGYSDILLLELSESSETHQYARQINKAGNRATRLVRQILTFSRRTEEERQLIQIHLIVKEVIKLLRSSFPATIEIRQNINDCGFVTADSTQLHQVIMNLCTNAFHAMRERKGVLEVRLEQVHLDQDISLLAGDLPEGQYICLTVSDTGYGIDKITMIRIFEPYFTTKKKDEGTGLGLSTVHGIVLSHGGGLAVESEVGQGTTFKIFLPIAESASILPQEKEVVRTRAKLSGRILFIDDVEFNVQLGTHVCKRIGCSAKGVTNSLEALALFREAPEDFDIIITDQTMPNLTGFELAVEMMKIRSDIPIIMVTGHSDNVDEQKAKEMGIREFLTKPLDMNILAEAIDRIMSS
ncbi:MAG: response regulator [Candidatus Electrothrix sp. AR5]|nr:response regulator [Candidatus Electrothrix sp. AR5]